MDAGDKVVAVLGRGAAALLLAGLVLTLIRAVVDNMPSELMVVRDVFGVVGVLLFGMWAFAMHGNSKSKKKRQ